MKGRFAGKAILKFLHVLSDLNQQDDIVCALSQLGIAETSTKDTIYLPLRHSSPKYNSPHTDFRSRTGDIWLFKKNNNNNLKQAHSLSPTRGELEHAVFRVHYQGEDLEQRCCTPHPALLVFTNYGWEMVDGKYQSMTTLSPAQVKCMCSHALCATTNRCKC